MNIKVESTEVACKVVKNKSGCRNNSAIGENLIKQSIRHASYFIIYRYNIMRTHGNFSLSDKLIYDNNGCVCDYANNKFRTIFSMCDAYHISFDTFRHKILNGESLKDTLEFKGVTANKVIGDAYKVFDEYFPSVLKIADRYKLHSESISPHLSNIEEYLTQLKKVAKDDKVYRTYSSLAERTDNTPNVIRQRIWRGWDMERALHQPKKKLSGMKCTDHLGKEYISQTEMCEHYKITIDAYIKRIKRGWTQERALTTPMRKHKPPLSIK